MDFDDHHCDDRAPGYLPFENIDWSALDASLSKLQLFDEAPASTKTEAVLKKLKGAKGVTLEALIEGTGWQAYSARGFLSGTAKKKLGHSLTCEVGSLGPECSFAFQSLQIDVAFRRRMAG